MSQVFISHSSKDQELAGLLARLLRSALNLSATDIRCTSVDGYRLPGGADFSDQIRKELLGARVFIGLISEVSFRSTWVLFELGARWGARKHLLPLLAPGVSPGILKGPVSQLNALRCDSQSELHQLVTEIADQLGVLPEAPASYQARIQEISLWNVKPASKEFTIIDARWGAGDATQNVTEFLRSKVMDGRLEIQATVQALDRDPAPMARKKLTVHYSYAGKEDTKIVPEDSWLSIP